MGLKLCTTTFSCIVVHVICLITTDNSLVPRIFASEESNNALCKDCSKRYADMNSAGLMKAHTAIIQHVTT